ncbi:MAG: ATP-binding protein [Desulfamplus sp.]|nr:ATP-binding protein [Desulfamplus sp.]
MQSLNQLLQATIPAQVSGNAQNQNGQKIEKITCIKHGEYDSHVVGYKDQLYPQSCPKCRNDEVEKQRAKEAEYDRQQKVIRYKNESGIPKRYKDRKITDVKDNESTAKALKWLNRYLEVLEERLQIGVSGSLCGDCGTGKTLMGCMMVNEIINRGHSAKYITAWKLIQEIRAAYNAPDLTLAGQIREFIYPEFLVIDEIGVQAGTQDERNLLYQVIDGRYNEMKSTLLISNLKDPVADGYVDARTIDRLRENGGFALTLSGHSYRV